MINGFELNGSEINGEGWVPATYTITLPGILGTPTITLFNDWSGAIPDTAIIQYLFDIDGDTVLRIPISSWQATLRADFSSYVQAVIPNAGLWASEISARIGNDFIITRRAVLPDGSYVDQEMARAPAQAPDFARGPTSYSCTLSGYAIQFYTPSALVAATTRTLRDVRSVNTGAQTRARAGIDWFLRPGQQAVAGSNEFAVSYINYYVNDRDQYMDVGGAAA